MLVASGLIVGESLFGVLFAGLIVSTGKAEPLGLRPRRLRTGGHRPRRARLRAAGTAVSFAGPPLSAELLYLQGSISVEMRLAASDRD